MGVTALMKWWMSLSRAEMLSLGLTAAGVTTAGVVIAPRALVARQAETAAPITHNGLNEVRLEILQGLHALLSSCDALISVREERGSRGAAVTLWHGDDRERGVVNEDELLVLLHSPLLRTLTAYTSDIEDEVAPGPSFSADALIDESMPENWRARPGVRGRVIATDITAVAIERGREAGGMATLTLTLHWDGPTSDEPDVGAATVSLPAVHRAGLARQ